MCQYICEYDVITDLIPPPKPSGSNKYTVKKIEKYWGGWAENTENNKYLIVKIR